MLEELAEETVEETKARIQRQQPVSKKRAKKQSGSKRS